MISHLRGIQALNERLHLIIDCKLDVDVLKAIFDWSKPSLDRL